MFRRDIRDHSRVFLPQHLTFESHHWKSKKLKQKDNQWCCSATYIKGGTMFSQLLRRLPFGRHVPAVLECRYWLHSSASLVFKHRLHVSGSEWSASSNFRVRDLISSSWGKSRLMSCLDPRAWQHRKISERSAAKTELSLSLYTLKVKGPYFGNPFSEDII